MAKIVLKRRFCRKVLLFVIGVFSLSSLVFVNTISTEYKYFEGAKTIVVNTTALSSQGAESSFKFIIVMATYQRRNQRSPYYIKRSVRSILAQDYSEWELFATGDKYVNETEFQYIFRNVPANKLFLHNLEKPGERGKVSGINLWYCVGATAMNNALDRAEEKYRHSEKYRDNKLIIAHLDDDDTWHPSHLQNLVNAYSRFPSVSFIWSKGYYCLGDRGGVIFPLINVSNTINNKPPTSGLTLHSSVSWKMRTFHSFRYRRVWEYRGEKPTVGDGDLWRRMTSFMLAKNIDFYHSLTPTVEHLQEQQSKPCIKADNQSSWYPGDNS